MTKILIITGSPRKGNSYAMVESFKKAAEGKGALVKIYDSVKMRNAKSDFKQLDEDLLSADGIVLASPVYWYTFPADIKAVIDHLYFPYIKGNTFKGKKAAMIACCEETTMETFNGINFSFDKTMELMEAEIVGKVEIPGVLDPNDIKNTDGEAQAARLADKFTSLL